MRQPTLLSNAILIALITSLPALAQDGLAVDGRPSHYTVRFGATIGELEPIAGEMLCARDRDCEILLAFVPEITIRLRADPDNVRQGQAAIDCTDRRCVLNYGNGAIPYGAKVNDLRISTGRWDEGVIIYPVLRPTGTVGRFTFVVAQLAS